MKGYEVTHQLPNSSDLTRPGKLVTALLQAPQVATVIANFILEKESPGTCRLAPMQSFVLLNLEDLSTLNHPGGVAHDT